MAESPYGLAYGLGAATSNMMGSYMQGQQYGLQRDAQQQQMEIAKRHAAQQERLGEAQIEHYGMQNKQLAAKAQADEYDLNLQQLGEATHSGNWELASQIGAKMGYNVAPDHMAFATTDGKRVNNIDQADGVMFLQDGQNPMFVPKAQVNAWRSGRKYTTAMDQQAARNAGNLDVAGVKQEASQYRDDKRLEGVKYSADKHYEAVIGNAKIRAAAEQALSASGGGKKTDTQRAADAFAEQAGRVDKNGNPKPNADDYRDARRLWSEGNPGSFNGRIFSVLEANDPKFRKLDENGKSQAVLGFYEKLGKHKERQPSGGGNGGGGRPAPVGTRVTVNEGGRTVIKEKQADNSWKVVG